MSSKHRVVVLKIVAGELSVTEAAAEYGMSRQYLDKLLARYHDEGLEGLAARSWAPLTNPQAITSRVRDRIVQLRHTLTAAGTDAGPVTIAWHLRNEGLVAPSTSTIRRILHTAGLIAPEPGKRPLYPHTYGSKRPSPTKPGSPTSPTGASRTALTSRS